MCGQHRELYFTCLIKFYFLAAWGKLKTDFLFFFFPLSDPHPPSEKLNNSTLLKWLGCVCVG